MNSKEGNRGWKGTYGYAGLAICLIVTAVGLSCTADGGKKEQPPQKTDTDAGNPAEAVYKDGTYSGKSFKFPGAFVAEVKIATNRIVEVKVVKHKALQKYTDILKPMIERIIEKQTSEVDGVTGATISSKALRVAVSNALAQARQSNTDGK